MAKLRIGFVPSVRGSRKLDAWRIKMRDDSLAALRRLPDVEILAPTAGERCAETGATANGVVVNLDDGEAFARYLRRREVDALVLCPLDFGDERSAVKVAETLRVPTLLYATKEPPALDDRSLARVSDSYCGNLSMASGLYRRKIPFYYAGIYFPGEPEYVAALETFVRAALVCKRLRGARIGHVGVRPATFETVGYDESAMVQKFAQNVIYANLCDITAAAKKMPADDPRVQATMEQIAEGMEHVTVGKDYVLDAARMELALGDFFRENGLSSMAVQCWPSIQREFGISLCAVFGRLTGQGMLTACEVDVVGALAMMANYAAAFDQTLPHFVDWTIQHRDDPNLLLAWHCGNAPVALATDPAQTALRSRKNMTGEGEIPRGDVQAGLAQFQIRPGVVTFCRLAEYDGNWKMLIARGEIEPSDESLAGTWSWVRVPDHGRLYRTLVEEGFIHHASMIHGDQVEALTQACRYLEIKPVVVT